MFKGDDKVKGHCHVTGKYKVPDTEITIMFRDHRDHRLS